MVQFSGLSVTEQGFKTLKLGLETLSTKDGASLGTHLLSKKDRHLSEATGRTYVKEDDKHDRPLMDSSHQPYGDIWPGGVRLFDQVSDAKAKSELVSKLIPHI